MHVVDWVIVACFLIAMISVGVFFSKKAGDSIESFFVSGRTLKWYVAGASIIATSFACDTPLWIGSLIRTQGLHMVWQYWSPLIGCALAVALFARVWRRSELVTDAEMTEHRYSGDSAATLRGISASVGAILLCPLIIGWVAKAMVTISKEALGLPEIVNVLGYAMSSDMLATLIVMLCALILCAFSGLYGVVYTDFIQFIIATIGAFILAYLSVKEVGGLKSMVEQLSSNKEWAGSAMEIAPKISWKVTAEGSPGTMSSWNFVGFFFLLWWGNALCGGYNAQRVLACKDEEHASNAMLTHTLVYFAVICWPWIVVALCSIIIFPDMGAAGDDAAYPRMLLYILPIGLKGVMISAMIAAFISTISTLFNWGSSYIINDVYRRFAVKNAKPKHYVSAARVVTFIIAILGGIISMNTDSIQELLQIAYVVSAGATIVGMCRWFWWRINATGELVAFVVNWVFATFMLFGHTIIKADEPLLDGLMTKILNLEAGVSFTNSGDLLGARMLLVTIIGLLTVVVVSLATKPTTMEQLIKYIKLTRFFEPGWRHVTKEIPGYKPAQTLRQVVFDWALVTATVFALLFSMSNIVRYNLWVSAGQFALFGVLLWIVVKRTKVETHREE